MEIFMFRFENLGKSNCRDHVTRKSLGQSLTKRWKPDVEGLKIYHERWQHVLEEHRQTLRNDSFDGWSSAALASANGIGKRASSKYVDPPSLKELIRVRKLSSDKILQSQMQEAIILERQAARSAYLESLANRVACGNWAAHENLKRMQDKLATRKLPLI